MGASEALLADVRRVTTHYEREFRVRVYQAQTAEDRRAAEYGLRHAVGFRKSVEQLFTPAPAAAGVGS